MSDVIKEVQCFVLSLRFDLHCSWGFVHNNMIVNIHFCVEYNAFAVLSLLVVSS